MSYILDALRRADAERERGSVPGLHSQSVPSMAPEPVPRSSPATQIMAGIGGVVVLLGVAGWFLLRTGGEPAASAPPAAPTTAVPPAAVAVAVAPPASAIAAAPPAAPTTAPTVTPAPPPALPRAPLPLPAPAALPSPPAPPQVAPPAAAAPAPAVAPAVPPSPPAVPMPAPAPPRAESRVINFEQLPEDVRRAIPPVAIGGAIYSDNAASRMLIVGGQLLHEGDSAAPGVTLEQIKPRSAVLRWKDLRYEVNF